MRLDEAVLSVRDPDGLQLELAGALDAGEGDAIGKIYSATIFDEGYQRTGKLLTYTMGFR